MAARLQDRMQLITTPEFLADVDGWRRRQPDIPNRSEAIRRMVAIAARAEQATHGNDTDKS